MFLAGANPHLPVETLRGLLTARKLLQEKAVAIENDIRAALPAVPGGAPSTGAAGMLAAVTLLMPMPAT